MILHQRKVQSVIASKIHMDHCYPKKDAKPSSTTSLSTFVFGFFTFIVCDNLGIDVKNSSIFLNCCEFIDSRNSVISFLVQSPATHTSSSVYILSIQDAISLNDCSIAFSSLKSKLFLINSSKEGYLSSIIKFLSNSTLFV